MNTFLLDVRYSARKLLRSPGFSLVAVATLALAVGATTAVFSIVDGVLLKPLPFAEPDRLVRVMSASREGKPQSMSYLDFQDYRTQSHTVAAMSPIDVSTRNLTTSAGDPLRLRGARVGANFFDLTGVRPLIGRAFVPGDAAAGAPATVMLSEGLWRNRFGAERTVLGQGLSLDGKLYTVIGVAPATIDYPSAIDAWFPFIANSDDTNPGNRGAHYLEGIGRLAANSTPESARRELVQIARRLENVYPRTNTNFSATAMPLRDALVGDVKPALLAMLGCVGFVLLIACANVANLLLVRAAGREAEMAIRTALGGGQRRLVRQLLAESLMLSLVGAAAGTALAYWAVNATKVFGPKSVPRLDEVAINSQVLVFAAIVAVGTGVLFGLVPVLHTVGMNISQMLREGTRGSGGRRGSQRTRAMLVVAETALAVVLLVGAGLLAQSFAQLTRVDLGFIPDHVITASVTLPGSKYPWDRDQRSFTEQLVAAMKRMPGTQSAAAAFGRPLADEGMRLAFDRDDRPPNPPEKRMVAGIHSVTADFFSALGVRLIAGRALTAQDRSGTPPVLVVSEGFAKRYYPGEDPLGKQITLAWTRDTSETGKNVKTDGEIVGVVADVKHDGVANNAFPAVYLPFEQVPVGDLSIVVRSTADPRLVSNAIRAETKRIDPNLPVFDLKTMNDAVADSISQPRFYALLFGAFAAIALLLAALGIYGVISYAVSQRTRELGVRLALGSGSPRLVWLVLAQGMRLTVIGLVIGLGASAGLSRLLGTLLFGVKPLDPATFGLVTLLLVGTGTLACYVPARRASTVDPLTAMRAE